LTAPRPARGRLLLAGLALALLGACAQPPRPAGGAADHWSGRLAVQVEDASAQSFSAGFELQGSPQAGELTLFNPLGNVMAQLQWRPGLPIAALFGWLKGEAVQATGWQADLSALGQGRLTATRHTPAPQTILRVALSL